MDPIIDTLAGSLKDLLKERLGGYLSREQEKKEFLEERARRMAELTVEMAKAITDSDERARIRRQMETVGDTIVNELHAAAIDISVEFRASVRDTLATVYSFSEKVLPIVMKAVAKAA